MFLHQASAEIWPISALLIAAVAVLGLVAGTVLPLTQRFGDRG